MELELLSLRRSPNRTYESYSPNRTYESYSSTTGGKGAATVGLTVMRVGNETNDDVTWSAAECAAATAAARHGDHGGGATIPNWCRAGVTIQSEDGSVPGTMHIAYVRTPVPVSVDLQQASTMYFFGVAETSITDPLMAPVTTPLQRALGVYNSVSASSDAGKAELWSEHQAAWKQLWHTATVELDTPNQAIRRAVNATIYAIFTLHDESDFQPFPGTPLDGVTLGSFGHWGGCYLWDADMWMHPAIAIWRPVINRSIGFPPRIC